MNEIPEIVLDLLEIESGVIIKRIDKETEYLKLKQKDQSIAKEKVVNLDTGEIIHITQLVTEKDYNKKISDVFCFKKYNKKICSHHYIDNLWESDVEMS